MGLSISSLINNLYNNETERQRKESDIVSDNPDLATGNIYVRKIKPVIRPSGSRVPALVSSVAKNVIDSVKKTYFNTVIFMSSGISIPNNENLGVCNPVLGSGNRDLGSCKCSCNQGLGPCEAGSPVLGTGKKEKDNSILFCVFLDNDVQGYIRIFNSENEDIVKQNIKKLDDFIMSVKISYLREIGYSSDYIYSWINLIDKIDDSIKNYSDEFENKDVFKTILLKKGKNLPISYDRRISTLKIKIISEILNDQGYGL
jgi:hypothetical protein